jgi:uncharacterized membrane protein
MAFLFKVGIAATPVGIMLAIVYMVMGFFATASIFSVGTSLMSR